MEGHTVVVASGPGGPTGADRSLTVGGDLGATSALRVILHLAILMGALKRSTHLGIGVTALLAALGVTVAFLWCRLEVSQIVLDDDRVFDFDFIHFVVYWLFVCFQFDYESE